MKNVLHTLSGWQRLFIVLTIVIQLPLTILFALELPITYTTAKEMNEKFQPIAVKEKLTKTFLIHDEVTFNAVRDVDGDSLLVTFNPSIYNSYFVYLDNRMSEEQKQTYRQLVQSLIDNEIFNSKVNNFLVTFVYSILLSISIYLLGTSIGWVINGFRKT